MEMRERPQIIYVLVIRGPRVVLAEYTALAGNFQQATVQILQKLEHTTEWKSYIYGEYAFHYIVDDASGLWFVCMAERTMGRRIPFAFLGAVQEECLKRFRLEEVQSAIAYGMQHEFRPALQHLMERYNAPDADRISAMMEKVQHINDNLMESIDKILERQEKIELLVSRTETLAQSSGSFVREAGRLRQVLWWQNARTVVILCAIVAVAVLIIAMASCGITFEHC
mmetsp:Transcript_131518/g.262437  ORF Transcript_131518/g.262437 Transcript_131518/m.262437 type:complete len:226 (-) Transcript_131518:61-738(-)